MGETKQTLVDILDADEDYIRVDNCTELTFTWYEDDPHSGMFDAEDADRAWVIARRESSFWDLKRFSRMEPFVYKVEDRVYIHKDLGAVKNVINNTFDVLVEVKYHDRHVWRLDVGEMSYSNNRLQIVIEPKRDGHYYGFMEADGEEFQEILQEYGTNENDCWEMRDERYRDVWEYLTRNKMEKWLRYRSPRDRFTKGKANTIRKKWIQLRKERYKDIVTQLTLANRGHVPTELTSKIANQESTLDIEDAKRKHRDKKGSKSSKKPKTKLRF